MGKSYRAQLARARSFARSSKQRRLLDDLAKQIQQSENNVANAQAKNYHYQSRIQNNPHQTAPLQTKMGRRIYDRLWQQMNHRVEKWANMTAAEFRNWVPVDTGNLRDSIKVLAITRDKSAGRISAVVGVDSHAVATAPPRTRLATGQGSHKKGQKVHLPDYDYSPFVLGESNATKTNVGAGRDATAIARGAGRGRVGGRRVKIEHPNGLTYDWTTYDRISTWSKIAKKNVQKIIKAK